VLSETTAPFLSKDPFVAQVFNFPITLIKNFTEFSGDRAGCSSYVVTPSQQRSFTLRHDLSKREAFIKSVEKRNSTPVYLLWIDSLHTSEIHRPAYQCNHKEETEK
jgi:hypothetical protein